MGKYGDSQPDSVSIICCGCLVIGWEAAGSRERFKWCETVGHTWPGERLLQTYIGAGGLFML